jgi:tetratricopeptide (TPR) repeat protein
VFLKKSSQKIADVSTEVRRHPSDAAAYLERGQVFARFGQFKDAAADFERSMKLGPKDPREIHTEEHLCWYLYGASIAYLDDREAYKKHCKKLVDDFGNKLFEPFVDERSSKVCFILPDSMPDLSVAMTMCNRGVGRIGTRADGGGLAQESLTPLAPWFYLGKGMGEYRTGHDEEAIKWLTRSHDGLSGKAGADAGAATADLFLAMANRRLNKAPEAKLHYLRAKEAIAKLPKAGLADGGTVGVENWMICHTVYRETRAMFGDTK